MLLHIFLSYFKKKSNKKASGTNHLIFTGGGGEYQKMTKNCLQEAKAGKKLSANSLSKQKMFAWQF